MGFWGHEMSFSFELSSTGTSVSDNGGSAVDHLSDGLQSCYGHYWIGVCICLNNSISGPIYTSRETMETDKMTPAENHSQNCRT